MIKVIKAISEAKEIIPFAWYLSQKDACASYPRVKKLSQLTRRIEKSITAANERVVACVQGTVLQGVCVYFWDPDERYAQATLFLILEDQYEASAGELVDHIRKELGGYELLIGVPAINHNAIDYFTSSNFECIESSFDTRLYNLGPQTRQQNARIEEITDAGFAEYASFHDRYAIPNEMYYHSDNLKRELERFKVWVYRQEEMIRGSIFVKTFKNGAEVFGLFTDEDHRHKGVQTGLINKMLADLYNKFGALEEIVYFIEEDNADELDAALDAGFAINDHYRCYRCQL